MPLLEGEVNPSLFSGSSLQRLRRQSEQYSDIARTAIMSSVNSSPHSETDPAHGETSSSTLMLPPRTVHGRASPGLYPNKSLPHGGVGASLTDTPLPSEPASPQM